MLLRALLLHPSDVADEFLAASNCWSQQIDAHLAGLDPRAGNTVHEASEERAQHRWAAISLG
jgi:hypothetical protein